MDPNPRVTKEVTLYLPDTLNKTLNPKDRFKPNTRMSFLSDYKTWIKMEQALLLRLA